MGHEAVPFFFLLSGFILSDNYFPKYTIGQHLKFIFLRFARLWPVHFVTLMLSAPMLYWQRNRIEELFMVRIWFHNDVNWNRPAWSISAEWFAYIFIFPLAFLWFRRMRSIPLLAIIVALCLAAQSFAVYDILFPSTDLCGKILFIFLAGSGLYRIRSLVKEAPAEWIVWSGVSLFLGYILFQQYLPALVLYAAFALLVFGLSYERGVVAKLLSGKIIVLGGQASYSLYMTHYLVIQSFIYYTWPYWNSWNAGHQVPLRFAILLGMIGVFITVMSASYRFVEVPANRKLRDWWAKIENRTAGKPVLVPTGATVMES